MANIFLPTRDELEEIIASFNANEKRYEDLRRMKYPQNLPVGSVLRNYTQAREKKGFAWSHYSMDNPYRWRCGVFSEAYSRHLNANGVQSLCVGTMDHSYLLVPVNENGVRDVLIFDPTAEQIYERGEKTYFLGTPKQLAAYHTEKVAQKRFHELYPDRKLGLEDIYFTGLCTSADVPAQLAAIFPDGNYLHKEYEGLKTPYNSRMARFSAPDCMWVR